MKPPRFKDIVLGHSGGSKSTFQAQAVLGPDKPQLQRSVSLRQNRKPNALNVPYPYRFWTVNRFPGYGDFA